MIVISTAYHYFLKKKGQGWSTILPISTKRTTTSHLNLLNIKKTMSYGVGITKSWHGSNKTCGVVN